MIEPDELLDKALNDAFVAGRSKQSFKAFKREWIRATGKVRRLDEIKVKK